MKPRLVFSRTGIRHNKSTENARKTRKNAQSHIVLLANNLTYYLKEEKSRKSEKVRSDSGRLRHPPTHLFLDM